MKSSSIVPAIIFFSLAAALPAPASAKAPFGNIADKGRVGGPGTTTPIFVENLENASASLKRLKQDSETLYSDQAALIVRVDNVRDFLNTSANRLGLISTLDADLKALEASLNTINTAATSAEAIPQAREKAKKIKDTLAPIKANVTAARQRVDAIKLKTEPIRLKLENAAGKADKVSKALWGINEGVINNMRFPISTAAGCLKKLPADKQACAGKNIDDTADAADAVAREYDRVVRALLTNPSPWLPSMNFFDPFNADLGEVDALRAEIERLSARLSELSRQLGKVNSVLGESFSFSFPYPNPSVTNPFRTSDYDVSISFKTILNGVDSIENAIEDKIGGFLWSVLNKLGVGKYVKELQDKANHAVMSALNALNVSVDLNLPNMDILAKLENAEIILSADLDALKFPEVDPGLPSFGLPDVPAGMDFGRIRTSISFFNPSGLNWKDPGVCNGAAYGCD